MKYFDWLELKTLKLKQYIEITNDNVKTLTFPKITDVITEEEYEPLKLSQKVFSFNLFFKYDANFKHTYTYIFGLIFNYKIFLYGLSKGYFSGYKFRVYTDKKSFFMNKTAVFYLMMLKKVEKELLSSIETNKINYNWLEIILCNYNDETEPSVITALRFLPIFEGCECHSRDLDFRLSSYDIELIRIFDGTDYPFYSHSEIGYNALMGGCIGGNILKNFKSKETNKINENIFKFYTPECFIAFIIICKNMFNVKFGLDEFVLRFYFSLLSDTYLENILIFGRNMLRYIRPYIFNYYFCIQKTRGLQNPYFDTVVSGINFTNKLFEIIDNKKNVFTPLIMDFKNEDTNYNIYEQYNFLSDDYKTSYGVMTNGTYKYDSFIDSEIKYNIDLKDINPKYIHPILYPFVTEETDFIRNYNSIKFNREPFINIIKRVNDNVEIKSIPIDSIIKLRNSTIIYEKNFIPKISCDEILNKTATNLKFIFFTKSKIIFTLIFNSDDKNRYEFKNNSICGLGKRFLDTIEPDTNVCQFYTTDDLVFFNKDGVTFDPFKISGGFYHKYLKYKSKYIKLKNKK
jgi:hypothetical protein